MHLTWVHFFLFGHIDCAANVHPIVPSSLPSLMFLTLKVSLDLKLEIILVSVFFCVLFFFFFVTYFFVFFCVLQHRDHYQITRFPFSRENKNRLFPCRIYWMFFFVCSIWFAVLILSNIIIIILQLWHLLSVFFLTLPIKKNRGIEKFIRSHSKLHFLGLHD